MMIPRILVPPGARLSEEDVIASSRRRPSSLDERTLVPAGQANTPLETKSTIPSNLPLDSIAARVVVPRDVNVEKVQAPDTSNLPAQPTDMDERVTIPQGAALPEEMPAHFEVPEDLVAPDIMSTGEVSLLPPERPVGKSREDIVKTAIGQLVYVGILLLLIFEPQIFGPHVRTKEEEEIGRRQMTVLLPPGALDALKPMTPPAPHAAVRVDPKVLKKVAPPIVPPAPQPLAPVEQPKRELPSAPVPQQSAQLQPQPSMSTPAPKTEAPLKLQVPDAPTPTKGLILPKQSTAPGDVIRDAERSGRMNSPAPIGGGAQIPGGGGGGGGGRGTAAAGIEMLTDTEGIDFNDYLRRVYLAVKSNWFAVMPASVQLGDQGVVSLQFKIMRNGGVPDGDPAQVFSSGKEPLDRAAYSSIRASNPFPPLPAGFKADHIELRFTYYYNLKPPN
jgi:TonB family protein